MPNQITDALRAQFFAQESNDPFLMLVTLENSSFILRLVNNSSDIVSGGHTYTAFPMKIRLPIDDGQTSRDIQIDFDNVSLEMIRNIRSVTEAISVRIDMILASMPDVIQMTIDNLSIGNITYNAKRITAAIVMDNFLSVEMTSERYTPSNYPGLF
jgi:uncharacterized protein DUF1833